MLRRDAVAAPTRFSYAWPSVTTEEGTGGYIGGSRGFPAPHLRFEILTSDVRPPPLILYPHRGDPPRYGA